MPRMHPDSHWAHVLLAVTNQLRADYLGAVGHARQAIETIDRLGLRAEARPWTLLAGALNFLGRFAESRAAAEEGAAIAEDQGRVGDQVESLYLVVQAAIAADLDADVETVLRVQRLAESSSNRVALLWATFARAIAASRTDLAEAARLFREALLVAESLGSVVATMACRAYGSVCEHPDDPVAALSGLGAALDEFAGHRLPFELGSVMRDMLPAFAQLGRYETVAVLDGAANAFAQRPAAARQAAATARSALGDHGYDAIRERGGAMTDDELEAFLRGELALVRGDQPQT